MDSILGITVSLIFLFIFGWGIHYTVTKPKTRPYSKAQRQVAKQKMEEQTHQAENSLEKRQPVQGRRPSQDEQVPPGPM